MEMEKMIIPMYVPDREIAKATSYLRGKNDGGRRLYTGMLMKEEKGAGVAMLMFWSVFMRSGVSNVDAQGRVHDKWGWGCCCLGPCS